MDDNITNRFEKRHLVVVDGKIWRPAEGYVEPGRVDIRDPKTGRSFVAPDEDGVVGILTNAGFEDLLLSDRAKVITAPSVNAVRAEADMAQWDLDDAVKLDAKVPLKLALTGALDDSGVKNGVKAINRWIEQNWTLPASKNAKSFEGLYGRAPSAETIRKWRSERGVVGARTPAQMVSMRGRKRRTFYSDEVVREVLMRHALLWATEPVVDYVEVSDDVKTEIAAINDGRSKEYAQPPKPYPTPSYWTVRRAVISLRNEFTELSKNGRHAVTQKYEGGGSPLRADFPGEIIQIDHTRLNVFCVDPELGISLGRPWLSVAIDVATRCVVAHVISYMAPSAWTVGQLLMRMALPKRPPPDLVKKRPILKSIRVRPDLILCDNGVEFRSHAMEHAAKAIGFSICFCPVKKPRYRAVVERLFDTVPRWICNRLPGATRPIPDVKLYGYDGEKLAFVLIEEVEALANWAVAEYNLSPHTGIGNRQPALLWERHALNDGIDNVADLDRLKIECLAVKIQVELSNGGVRLFGLRYHGAREIRELLNDLLPLECRRQGRTNPKVTVTIKYDQQDVGRIHVFNRATKKYVELACDDPSYAAGMPLWLHKQLEQVARDEGAAFSSPDERAALRSRRIEAIRNINPKAKAAARSRLAALLEIPRIRQVVGNLVHLEVEPPSPGTVHDFISHDLAAPTALDIEILAPRPDGFGRDKTEKRQKAERNDRDRRNAGQPRPAAPTAPSTTRRRDEPVATGGYS